MQYALFYPQPNTPPISTATYKQCAEDFIVKEQLEIDFSDQGEHLWLYIEKRHLNTAYVARLLADWANIPARDVGYSGLKDRHARTYQWFSLRLPTQQIPEEKFEDFCRNFLKDDEQLTVLEQRWHTRKLNRGTHQANYFCIQLRDVVGDVTAIDAALQRIRHDGVPNYFGEQRFGNAQANIEKATTFLTKWQHSNKSYRPNKKTAERDSLLISTARSVLFNEMLSKRVTLGNWNRGIDGDVFNLAGSGSIFCDVLDDALKQRIDDADIHPTAPLFGVGQMKYSQDAKALYDEILADEKLQTFTQGLLAVNARLGYRALRLMPSNLRWQWLDAKLHTGESHTGLRLEFDLPKGTFATVILQALCQTLHQPNSAQA